MPDFPRPRDWGCVSCDAAFFKEKESVVDCFLEGTIVITSFLFGCISIWRDERRDCDKNA